MTRKRAKTIIHVNQHAIKSNKKLGMNLPTIAVKHAGKPAGYAYRVQLTGPSEVIYSPDKPLGCGARCWIETHAPVVLDGEITV